MDKRWVILLLLNIAFTCLIHTVNDALSSTSIYLILTGLNVYIATFYLPLESGLLFCFLLGLFIDTLPPSFGYTSIILCSAFTILSTIKQHITIEKTRNELLIIQCTNAFIILISHLVFATTSKNIGTAILTLLASQSILVVLSAWFIKLQLAILSIFNLTYDSHKEL